MTKSDLEKKLADLQEQHKQLVGNLTAVSGAIQFAEILLKEWTDPEVQVDKVKK